MSAQNNNPDNLFAQFGDRAPTLKQLFELSTTLTDGKMDARMPELFKGDVSKVEPL